MTTIRTRICNDRLNAVEVLRKSTGRGSALSVSGGLVKVGILPTGMAACRARVRVSIIPAAVMADNAQLFECAGYGDAGLDWFRGVDLADDGDFIRRHQFITMAYNHPDDPCHWVMTRLYGQRLIINGQQLYISTSPNHDGGPIPQDGEAWHTVSDQINGMMPQCQFVPGEGLQLEWTLRYGSDVRSAIVADVWFATPAFTGGEVISIDGNGEDKTITVRFQGLHLSCIPTDFAEYEAGDWVYVLKQGNSDATDTDRDSVYGASDASTETMEEGGSGTAGLANDILVYVNKERAASSLAPYTANAKLAAAASEHSKDMAENNYLDHTGSDGSSPYDRIFRAGYLNGVDLEADSYGTGENVAYGYHTALACVAAWMSSANHRANIMNENFKEIGIGIDSNTKYGDETIYVTQNFGFVDFVTPPEEEPEPDYRVVPVRFSGYGADGEFETIDYDLESPTGFVQGFEVSQHIGTIVEIYSEDDEAKITIDGLGEFDRVPIFYHCEDAATVTGGASAFSVDDDVVVLNEGGGSNPSADDLVIVGFKDGLKSCCWIEPFDGPLYTTKWPWVRLAHYIRGVPGTLTDDATAICSGGSVTFSFGPTPAGQGWLEQQHTWKYDPATLIRPAASMVKFDAEIMIDYYEMGDENREYYLYIFGKKNNVDIYFSIYVLNNNPTHPAGVPLIGCTGIVNTESDWVLGVHGWYKTILNNKTEFITLPVTGIEVDYVMVFMSVYAAAGGYPPTGGIAGGSMIVNNIEIC